MTVFVRGEGGGVIEMDVPAQGSMAREAFDLRAAKGELVILDLAAGRIERVENDGAVTLRYVTGGDDADASTKDELVAQAKELGVAVKGTWGTKRIAQAIADRAALLDAARAVFDASELEAVDLLSNDDLSALIEEKA